jgi:predicted acyltransferase
MFFRVRGRIAWTLIVLAGYWLIVSGVSPPADYTATVTGPEGLLHDWIDVRLLGEHLYRERPDPEGVLSTLPAVATVLFGLLTGQWLQGPRDRRDTAIGLFIAANIALVLGLCWNCTFPINKKIWSSSYVVLTAGLALHFLAMCYWLIDLQGYRRWAGPFVVFGTNAIVVYVASSLMAKAIADWKLAAPDGSVIGAKTWIYEGIFASWAGPQNGSLFFAVSYVALWCLLLVPLYRRRILVKI